MSPAARQETTWVLPRGGAQGLDKSHHAAVVGDGSEVVDGAPVRGLGVTHRDDDVVALEGAGLGQLDDEAGRDNTVARRADGGAHEVDMVIGQDPGDVRQQAAAVQGLASIWTR